MKAIKQFVTYSVDPIKGTPKKAAEDLQDMINSEVGNQLEKGWKVKVQNVPSIAHIQKGGHDITIKYEPV